MIVFDLGDQAGHALIQDAVVIDEPAVRLVTVPPEELRIGITDGEVFRELDVTHQMLLVRLVVRVNREDGIARPGAALVHPLPIETTRAARGCNEAGEHGKKQ